MAERLFTAYQVADLLGTTWDVVAGWIRADRLSSQRLPGGSLRVSERQLVEFLQQEGIDIEQIMARIAADEGSDPVESLSAEASEISEGDTGETPRAVGEGDEVAPSPAADEVSEQGGMSDERVETPARANAASDGAELDLSPIQPNEAASGEDESVGGAGDDSPQDVLERPGQANATPADETPVAEEAVDEPAEIPPADEPSTARTSPRKAAPARPARKSSADIEAANPVDQVAQALIKDAVERGAEAIHLSARPRGEGLSLRLRLHGVLQEKTNFKRLLPKGIGPELITHLKTLASIEDSERGLLTGEFETRIDSRTVRLGASVLPTRQGEGIVLRLFDPAAAVLRVSDLHIKSRETRQIQAMLDEPSGLIILAGPPRNGAEQVLRAMACQLADGTRNVLLVERSGGMPAADVTRAICDGRGAFNWTDAMLAVAAQDVDVIANGDICEPETALAAVEAASAGTIVVGHMRVADAVAALDMLAKMGVAGWPLASVLLGIVSLRVVRTLCDECKKTVKLVPKLLASLGLNRDEIDFSIYAPRGCGKCGGSGYMGSETLVSVVTVDETVADLIRSGASGREIHQAAIKAGSADLFEKGLQKLREGKTSLEELAKAKLAR